MCNVNNEIYINILTMKGICLEFLNNSKILFPDPETWGIGWKFPFPLSPDSPRIISCRGIGIPICIYVTFYDNIFSNLKILVTWIHYFDPPSQKMWIIWTAQVLGKKVILWSSECLRTSLKQCLSFLRRGRTFVSFQPVLRKKALSVQPKFTIGIGNQNQGWFPVLESEP